MVDDTAESMAVDTGLLGERVDRGRPGRDVIGQTKGSCDPYGHGRHQVGNDQKLLGQLMVAHRMSGDAASEIM
jgi:hypothetical protein